MQTVIAGFDGSDPATVALRWAFRAADQRGWPLRILQSWWEPALAVLPDSGFVSDPERERRKVEAALADVTATIGRDHPEVRAEVALVDAKPVDALLESAGPDDLIVVGARGRGGFLGLHLGSVSAKLTRHADTPVVVVRGSTTPHGGGDPTGPVVVGVEATRAGRAALRWAADEAAASGAPLHAVMAWSYLRPEGAGGPAAFRPDYTKDDALAVVEGLVADVLGDAPEVEVSVDAPCDLPSDALLQRAGSARLVVVGARGHRHAGPLGLGSVSQQVLHHAPGPVAVVPAPSD